MNSLNDIKILENFRKQVVSIGPESTLPCNIQDDWLNVLIQHADSILKKGYITSVNIVVLAVIHILNSKSASDKKNNEDLYKLVKIYRLELGLERVRRTTTIKPKQASLKSIFIERNVFNWF